MSVTNTTNLTMTKIFESIETSSLPPEMNSSLTTQVILTPLKTGALISTLIPMCLVVLMIILGNVLVIIAIFRHRALRTPPNLYLVSLACVDLSVGIFILPLNILNIVQGGWILSKFMCKFYCTMDIFLCSMSILLLVKIALLRFQIVTEGVHYSPQSTKTVLVIVSGIGLLSFWISSPPLAGWDKDWLMDMDQTKRCALLNSRGYVIYSAFGSFGFPLAVMLFLYLKIYQNLKRRIQDKSKSFDCTPLGEKSSDENSIDQLASSVGSTSKSNSLGVKSMSAQVQIILDKKKRFSLTKERKAARTLGIIMAAFIICWIPFCLMYVVVPFCCAENPPSLIVSEFLTWLGYFNSALNPIIYSVFNMEFRKAFRKLLHLN